MKKLNTYLHDATHAELAEMHRSGFSYRLILQAAVRHFREQSTKQQIGCLLEEMSQDREDKEASNGN